MPKNFCNVSSSIYSNPKNLKAFTLVEVLAVIAIIVILSALVITALNPGHLLAAARDTNRQKDLGLISTALEQFYADHNSYPGTTSITCVKEVLEDINNACAGTYTPTGTVYIKVMPVGQSGGTEYCYSSTDAQNQNYLLCAPLEAETAEFSGTNCDPARPVGVTGTLNVDYGSICITNPF